MLKHILAIAFIYICTAIAWLILGGSLTVRTSTFDDKLRGAVRQLWGTSQQQRAPVVYYQTTKETKVETTKGDKTITETKTETTNHYFPLEASTIDIDLKLEHRRKGLLWYPTYRVKFHGKYRITNNTGAPRKIFFDFTLPAKESVYDNFQMKIGSKKTDDVKIESGMIVEEIALDDKQQEEIEVAYESQGMDSWWHNFGSDVSQMKNFILTMHTDFKKIDFPENSISPTEKKETDKGWELAWRYSNLLSGVQIGMLMPQKLNPGPWASKITFSAPVSLFLFFFLLFIYTTLRKIRVHPMNYFFIGTAFFSFHLLLAYLVDHISIDLAFLVCSAVSIFLVISYMRLVVGARFAFVEVGISQFIYLVLFSYTFFFEGYTGLTITILCIFTLFIVMQSTGRIDWEKTFSKSS